MNKLRTAQVLMCVTILLVFAFQFYWIRKLYLEENSTFKTTADLNFRESIYKLQSQALLIDSATLKGLPGSGNNLFMSQVLKDITKMKGAGNGKDIIISINSSSNSISKNHNVPVDTDLINHKLAQHIFLNEMDTAKHHGVRKFVFSSKIKDSVPLKSIDSLYTIRLMKENCFVPFTVLRSIDSGVNKLSKNFQTQKVPVGLFNPIYYSVIFENNTWFLIKKISLPIIFAFLLTGVTILSFIFLYRNLLAQKRLTAIKDEFIANITHELKTPIATVSVAIEAMKNFNVLDNPLRTREYLDIAGLELNRLSLLVDKVLRLSMFESEQVELKFQNFDLRDLATEVIKSMQLQFDKFNAEVTLQTKGIDFMIFGDRLHITSVLYNLLDNALKYSNGNPRIECHITESNKNILIQVKDKGIGIPPIYRIKVFDKFFRIPNGDQHNVKGYGLGLSYVAHITEKHKGSIFIEENTPNGSIININLPKHND